MILPPPTGAPTGQPAGKPAGKPERPADVDTGFWLWLTALVLLLIGQVSDAFTAQTPIDRTLILVVTAFLAVTVGGLVLTLLFLMRSGNRLSRTLLTAGGVVTIFYTLMTLLGIPRSPVAAVIFAVTGIFGSVFIGGGIYLVNRADSQRFFER